MKDALSANEQIIVRVQKHPIVLLWSLTLNLLFLSVIVSAAYFDASIGFRLPARMLRVAVLPFCIFSFSYLRWWSEEYFLTTHRVIRARGIINKRVSDSSLEKVNDVVLSQSWFGRILDFGDVEILTASESGANLFKTIRSPVRFKTAMLNQKEALGAEAVDRRTERPEKSRAHLRSNLLS